MAWPPRILLDKASEQAYYYESRGKLFQDSCFLLSRLEIFGHVNPEVLLQTHKAKEERNESQK
jgi:hypothetical protein